MAKSDVEEKIEGFITNGMKYITALVQRTILYQIFDIIYNDFIAKQSPITASTKTKITYNENGIITSGEDITMDDITEGENYKRLPSTKLDLLNLTSGINMGDETKDSIIQTLSGVPKIGQSFQGGILGYILGPEDIGYDNTKIQGLIICTEDITMYSPWSSFAFSAIVTSLDEGTGLDNTNTIIAIDNSSIIAAKLCKDYTGGDYNDWYLPSIIEFIDILNNIDIDNNNETLYWSSSQDTEVDILVIKNDMNGQTVNYNVSNIHLRAIRSFSVNKVLYGNNTGDETVTTLGLLVQGEAEYKPIPDNNDIFFYVYSVTNKVVALMYEDLKTLMQVDSSLHYFDVTIHDADVRTLNSIPFTLIDGVTDKIISIESIFDQKIGTLAYTTHTMLKISCDGTTDYLFTDNIIMSQTTDGAIKTMTNPSGQSFPNMISGGNIIVETETGNPGGGGEGNGIRIFGTYRLL